MDSSTPRTIKMGAERAIIYGMIMDVVRRCDAAYGKYQRRGSSIGATLETYMIVAAVLIKWKAVCSPRKNWRSILALHAAPCSGSSITL